MMPIGPSPIELRANCACRIHRSRSKYGLAGFRDDSPNPIRSIARIRKEFSRPSNTRRKLPQAETPGPEPCSMSKGKPEPPDSAEQRIDSNSNSVLCIREFPYTIKFCAAKSFHRKMHDYAFSLEKNQSRSIFCRQL